MAWCKQQQALDWANVGRNFTSYENTIIVNRIYQTNKKNLSRFPTKTTLTISMRNIQVIHLWQLDPTILTAQISRLSVERTSVYGCQSVFIALIASNSNNKNTYRLWTHMDLIWELSFKLCGTEKDVIIIIVIVVVVIVVIVITAIILSISSSSLLSLILSLLLYHHRHHHHHHLYHYVADADADVDADYYRVIHTPVGAVIKWAVAWQFSDKVVSRKWIFKYRFWYTDQQQLGIMMGNVVKLSVNVMQAIDKFSTNIYRQT